MKPRIFAAIAFGALFAANSGFGQQWVPKTSDETDEVFADGSASMTLLWTFDAANWTQWKSAMGEDPAQVRAKLRYIVGAQMVIDGFDIRRDDINRTATVIVHSAAYPNLKDDGRFSLALAPGARLVNGSGRTWYFSGLAGSTLNQTKITLPLETAGANVVNGGDTGDELVYDLKEKPGASHDYTIGGLAVLGIGILLLVAGLFTGKRPAAAV